LEEFSGRLLSAEPDEKSRFNFIIWFPYTQELIQSLQDGDLLAIPNFQTSRENTVYSVVKITNVLPKHFALRGREDTKSYPGYVLEAAKNIASSWLAQEKEPLEDTTIIEIEAIPTNLQFYISGGRPVLEEEKNMPMVGEEVKLLSSEFMTEIINKGIKFNYEELIEIGHVTRDERIKVYLRVEDLIKTHFGVFGFTGVGKSNLLSTTIRKLLTEKIKKEGESIIKENSPRKGIKILLFDLMDEYTSLLIDLILDNRLSVTIVNLDRFNLPKPTFDYLNGNSDELGPATEAYVRQMYIPKGLLNYRFDKYLQAAKLLLTERKIKVFEEETGTVGDMVDKIWPDVTQGLRSPQKLNLLEKFKKDVFSPFDREVTSEVIEEILSILGKRGFRKKTTKSIEELEKQPDLKSRIENTLIPFLEEMERKLREPLSQEIKITLTDLIRQLQKSDTVELYIFTSANPHTLREFAFKLGLELYHIRRRFGISSPLLLFLFDEADEFIPQKPPEDSYAQSKWIIETITRRGRKFGMGVGLATQRSAYLDTNIMGQLHTYFISKLPREYDRNVVAEAFGLPKSELVQTFKFRKGEWLLVSHDATGIESVPFPIYVENAEEAIKNFLDHM
jgi:hypothetical protein